MVKEEKVEPKENSSLEWAWLKENGTVPKEKGGQVTGFFAQGRKNL